MDSLFHQIEQYKTNRPPLLNSFWRMAFFGCVVIKTADGIPSNLLRGCKIAVI